VRQGTSCTRPSVIRNAPATRSAARRTAPTTAPRTVWCRRFRRRPAGLDDADFEPLDVASGVRPALSAPARSPPRGRRNSGSGFVDHDGDDRGQRIAVLARQGRIGERQQDQRQRGDAHERAARRASSRARRSTTAAMPRLPSQRQGPAVRRRCRFMRLLPQPFEQCRRAPDRPCSCRSAHTSRC
jgi:hypothetical protein